MEEALNHGMPFELTKMSKSIIAASLRDSTKKKYEGYIKRWKRFCSENDVKHASVSDVINFLTMLFESNNSYSAIKTAKAAVSQTVCLPPFSSIGDHPLIIKFMKGVFNLRPPKTKSGFIWDVSKLFNFFKSKADNDNLNFYDLSCKTLCILLLLCGGRVNTAYNFRVDEILINDIGITITPSNVLKHSAPNRRVTYLDIRHTLRIQ